jgi:O-succinylbenzoate synthase
MRKILCDTLCKTFVRLCGKKSLILLSKSLTLAIKNMKIDRIELIHIKMDLVSPFVTSMGTEYDEEHIIVRVDGEGVTGWGESVAEGTPFYSYETVTTAWHILRDFLIPSIIGKELPGISEAIALYEKVRGHMMAKAGLEAALWDAFAKTKGISLSKML